MKIDRRYDRVEITFARPRGIIGVHLYAGTEVPSQRGRLCVRKVKSRKGEPWPRSCKTCPAKLRPCSESFRPLFDEEVQPALPTEAENLVHVRRVRGKPVKVMCAGFLIGRWVLFEEALLLTFLRGSVSLADVPAGM